MYNPNYAYRPTNNYAQRLSALEQQYYQPWQQQSQPIQTINQNIQPQASCYFVNSPDELNGISITPNNVYLGINSNNKEVYIRRMDNNGITQLETYTLSANVEQKNEYKLILEQLTAINEKLTPRREEIRNESGTVNIDGNAGKNGCGPVNVPSDARKVAKPSTNESF